MSLFLATLLTGLFLALLGALLAWNDPRVSSIAKALPRSRRATYFFFGTGTVWFTWRISTLCEADLIFFKKPTLLIAAFAVLAALSFIYAPDFLAVRGLSILMLLAAKPLLYVAYMEWTHPQRLLMVTAVYIGLAAAIYLAAAPYQLRDLFDWLFQKPRRSCCLGLILLAYGLATASVAFTY